MSAATTPPLLSIDETLDVFIYTIDELLTGLGSVFPECTRVRDVKEEFDLLASPTKTGQTLLINQWHEAMNPLYQACIDRNVTLFMGAQLDILQRLDLSGKWHDPLFDAESRESLWTYIQELNMLAYNYCGGRAVAANVYDFVPKSTAVKIKGIAQRVAEQIHDGQQDLSSFNPFALSQSIVNEMTEEEAMAFMQNVPQIMQSMQGRPETQHAQALISENPGALMALMGAAGGGGAGGGGPDMGTLMQMFGGGNNNSNDNTNGGSGFE